MNDPFSTPELLAARDFDPDDPPRFGEWVRVDREPKGVRLPPPVTVAQAAGNSHRMIAGFGILLALAALIAVIIINPFRHPKGMAKEKQKTIQAPGGDAAITVKPGHAAPPLLIMNNPPGHGVNAGDHARKKREEPVRHQKAHFSSDNGRSRPRALGQLSPPPVTEQPSSPPAMGQRTPPPPPEQRGLP